tara:strand:+ start:317 stop:2707 length:2391 start_codon:yes stop_codon:yes gene_type:complete
MKNKFKLFLLILLINLNLNNLLFAEEFEFETSTINILNNGNTIVAEDGKVFFKEKNIVIDASKFEYNKKINLIAQNGIAKIINKNLQIKADKFNYDESREILKATGQINIKDFIQNLDINTDVIIYDIAQQTIKSDVNTSIQDNIGNQFEVKNFIYTINKGLIKLNGAKIIDVNKNEYKIDKAFLNLNSNKLIGKDISINFNNITFDKNNEPRLKGNSITASENNVIVKKGIFTTCKKNDDCPPWAFSAKEIKHDKKKKTIYYKDAWLKIYDTPVFYFPKFFHPDPTVKRQSGFLIPSIQDSSSLGASLNMPYYLVLSDNKDATFNPRFYSDEKFLLQSEYRQANKDSSHHFDLGFLSDGGRSSKNHLFYNGLKKMNLENFDESDLSVKLEQTSDETYLKTYKLESPIINNENLLNSSLDINLYREDFSFSGNIAVYEDLSKRSSDRYEYIYPNFNLVKQIENSTKLDGDFSVITSGHVKNYETNIYEKIIVNDLVFNSEENMSEKGITNEYNFIIKNVNTDGKNSAKFKEKFDGTLSSIIEYNTSYPLIKKGEEYSKIFKPQASFRVGTDLTRNLNNSDKRTDINNIYSLNRIGTNETLEGGASLTYGTEFSKIDNINSNKEILGLKIANVFRLQENTKLPKNSRLGEKTSDFVGELHYSPNDIIKINYDFAIKNNLTEKNYEFLTTEFKVNKFLTTFKYLNENNTANKESYLENTTAYNLSNSKNVSFSTRKNKKTKLTEFYNLIYQYKNDCLSAAIEYKKDYYSDKDLKPDESIFFKLTIIPFGQASTPNLRQ